MSYYNPHWQKAIQNQQRVQTKPSGKPQQQQPSRTRQQGKQPVRDDFSDEWVNRDVEAEVVKGPSVVAIRGRVTDVSKYWLKIADNGQTLYLNKAFILSIKPLEMKDDQGGPNAGGQSARQ